MRRSNSPYTQYGVNRVFFLLHRGRTDKCVIEMGLKPSRVLIEDERVSLRVRGWAAFCLGAMCSAGLDSFEDTAENKGESGLEGHINHLIRFLQMSSKDTEVCSGTMMGLGTLIGGVSLPCRDAGGAQNQQSLLYTIQ